MEKLVEKYSNSTNEGNCAELLDHVMKYSNVFIFYVKIYCFRILVMLKSY